jgi:hypothetical protein
VHSLWAPGGAPGDELSPNGVCPFERSSFPPINQLPIKGISPMERYVTSLGTLRSEAVRSTCMVVQPVAAQECCVCAREGPVKCSTGADGSTCA